MSRLAHLAAGTRRGLLLLGVAAAAVLLQGASGAPPLALRSGSATFLISSRIYPAPPSGDLAEGCSGPTAALSPGVVRCLVLQIDSSLGRDIEVESLEVQLDTAAQEPDQCTAALVLPTFGGRLLVPAGGRARTPGLPILLRNTRRDQDVCQGRVFHFRLTGTAVAALPSGGDPADPAGLDGLPETGSAFSASSLSLLVASAMSMTVLGVALVLVARRRPEPVTS